MVGKNISKFSFAVAGIFVFLTACQLDVTQETNAEAPVFSIEGEVDYNDAVTITTATEGAEIFYTTDGSTPTAESTKYTKPVAITADCTIKAIAVKSEMQDSVVVEKSFTVKKYTITFDANGHGTAPEAITGKHKGEKVTLPPAITATGFTFESWSDGTDTFAAGADYTVNGNVTIKATWTDWNTVATPVFSIAAGSVDYGDKITITCATEGAEIFYTTDGTAPTAGSKKYENEEIEITAATTIKAIATKAEMNTSAVAEKTYTIKLYTVTFDANGHGTAPDAMKGYKGEVIKLPAKIKQRETGEDKGWEFWYWNDGTTNYDAETNYTVNGDVTFKAVWNELVCDKVYKALRISYPNNGTVCFSWISVILDKVVFTYEPGNESKTKTFYYAGEGNDYDSITFEGLTNGTEYIFTITAYIRGYECKDDNIVIIPHDNGGLEGTSTYPEKIQGVELKDTLKEDWMADSGNLKINGTEIAKTSEVVVVPAGMVAKIGLTLEDDNENVFYYTRKVKLSPFVMSKYEVTRELFKAVMGDEYYNGLGTQTTATGNTDEEKDQNPVTITTWLDAIKFCNKLSVECGLNPVYSCNSETAPDKLTDADKIQINLKANGYRLPTEAEWEFSARGGDPKAEDWNYTYSGSNIATEVAWCKDNSNNIGTNIVGCMSKANRLGLYDMSGNVYEWCNDYYDGVSRRDDQIYKDSDDYVNDPFVISNNYYSSRVSRGGCWNDDAAVNKSRNSKRSTSRYNTVGFRLVRSIGRESN